MSTTETTSSRAVTTPDVDLEHESELIDPREAYPKPPFPQQEAQPVPGSDRQMSPPADHGENSYRGTGKLKGRAAIVTGADSGIGRAVAIAFAREGADVLISYLSEEEDAREIERLVTEAGVRALRVPGDIGDPNLCQQIVERAVAEFGRLDVLVNNAAFQQSHQSIAEFTPEEIERHFRTNVFAMFFLCQAALPHMKPGGSIINTASIQAYQPSPTLLAYAATKGAIINFTNSFAKQAMQSNGVRVNAVAPGPVWTPLIPSTLPREQAEKFGADTPLGRPAQPAELAPAYVFLASEAASYVTGAVYQVTGGETAI